jgi:aspartyl protease family protein
VGHVWVEALIGNPITGRSVRVRSLVDTGATYTVIPRRVFEELELPVIGRKSVKTARGLWSLVNVLVSLRSRGGGLVHRY